MRSPLTRRSALPAVLLSVALTASACANNDENVGRENTADSSTSTEAPMDPNMDMSSPSAASVDQQFLVAMAPHHQSAADMAEIALQRAKNPEVKALAQRIIDAQSAEIAQMQQIAKADFGVEQLSTEMMSETHEMMGMTMTMDMQADMTELETSPTPDKTFLEMMIPHHASAITMADEEIKKGTNVQVMALAQKIKDDQAKEIGEMQQLLTVVA